MIHPVLINGQFKQAASSGTFTAFNPVTGQKLQDEYPISTWKDIDEALQASVHAFEELRVVSKETIYVFLELYALKIEANREVLCGKANEETGLPISPRLNDVELPRTTGQLRLAAKAAREEGWRHPIIDTANNLRTMRAPIGPIVIFGPNNFPFAFNGISGGDFAAAIACGCPVIVKAHPSHPSTTRLLAEIALEAAKESGIPTTAIQMIYHLSNEDGLRFVADPRIGATAFTGSRAGGLALKKSADLAGKPFFGEMSSINPVVILPGSLEEKSADIKSQLVTSALMGTGQFCTNPGLILLIDGPQSQALIQSVADEFVRLPAGCLFGEGVLKSLEKSVRTLLSSGAELVTGGIPDLTTGCRFKNTVLKVSADVFTKSSRDLQTEAFGNCTLFVTAKDAGEIVNVIRSLEGNLTGCIYSSTAGSDDAVYKIIEPALRQKVGRLINDKMPTGVAVSPAQNHGGPFPASTHPYATAVGLPASIDRFTVLHCYDSVRQDRLPKLLQG